LNASWSDAAKAKKLRGFFQKHGRIYIVVNASEKDVRVPEDLKGNPALQIVLNVRMPQSITFHDDALESKLSFSGHVFPCRIPMHCIWAAYVPEHGFDAGILWESDVPDPVKAVLSAACKLQETDQRPVRDAADRVIPDSVKGKKAGIQPSGRRGRHLRVVK